jgi:hypothetical protein
MNIELIKSELEKLSLLLSAWSSDEPISPIERDVALDYLKHLYDQIRFGEAAAPAVPVMPAVAAAAEVAPQSEMEEQDEAQDEEKDVEVELIFADDEDLPQFGLLNELLSDEVPEADIEAEAEITPEPEIEVVPEPIAEPDPIHEPEPEILPEPEPISEPEPIVVLEAAIEPAPEPAPEIEPTPEPEPTPASASGSLFGEEPVRVRRSRSKHQRMMSIYNDSEPRPEKVVDISKIFDMDDDGPTEISVEPTPQPTPTPAPQPRPVAEPKAEPATLADVIAPAAPTLADTIAAPAALADEMHHTPIRSLREGIGLNDKFLMIRDLFDGDGDAYEEAISALDALPTLDDCMIHIIENYAWNPDSEGSKFIMQLLDRKLS